MFGSKINGLQKRCEPKTTRDQQTAPITDFHHGKRKGRFVAHVGHVYLQRKWASLINMVQQTKCNWANYEFPFISHNEV